MLNKFFENTVGKFTDNITKNWSDNVKTAFYMDVFWGDEEHDSKLRLLADVLVHAQDEGWDVEDPDVWEAALRDAGVDWELDEDEMTYIENELSYR